MIKIYIVDGVQYNVGPNREEEFLKKFPNATLQEQEVQVEKQAPVAETTAPAAGQTPIWDCSWKVVLWNHKVKKRLILMC